MPYHEEIPGQREIEQQFADQIFEAVTRQGWRVGDHPIKSPEEEVALQQQIREIEEECRSRRNPEWE